MLQGSSGSSYRLVVHFHDRQLIFAASPFSSYKQAVRHVATAVHRHARDGDIAKVCLQRGVPLGDVLARPERVSHWMTLEQWNGDVVGRILAQTGGVVAKELRNTAATPASVPAPSARPGNGFLRPRRLTDKPARSGSARSDTFATTAPTATPAARDSARKGHRWHVGLTLALAVIAWLAIAVVLADGRLGDMLGIAVAARPAEATELPFDAPAAGTVRSTDRLASQSATASQHVSDQ